MIKNEFSPYHYLNLLVSGHITVDQIPGGSDPYGLKQSVLSLLNFWIYEKIKQPIADLNQSDFDSWLVGHVPDSILQLARIESIRLRHAFMLKYLPFVVIYAPNKLSSNHKGDFYTYLEGVPLGLRERLTVVWMAYCVMSINTSKQDRIQYLTDRIPDQHMDEVKAYCAVIHQRRLKGMADELFFKKPISVGDRIFKEGQIDIIQVMKPNLPPSMPPTDQFEIRL